MTSSSREIRRAVITGPTGAIGTALCRCLLDHGVVVYAVCRPGTPRAAALPASAQLHIVECDAGQLQELPDLLPDGADAFFHFAWAHTIGEGRNDMSAQIDNIRYTIEAVRAAKKMNCQVFLGAGSQAEYGRVEGVLRPETPCFPENGYGMAKLCAGQMSCVECERLGLDHIWFRVLSVYGPRDGEATMISSTIRKLLAGEVPELTLGEQVWDYLYADDAANAFYLAAIKGKNRAVYPLGSGEAHPLREYVNQLRDAVDPELSLGYGKIPYHSQQVMYLKADISALKDDTGFSPEVPFKDGIQRTVDYMRNRTNV